MTDIEVAIVVSVYDSDRLAEITLDGEAIGKLIRALRSIAMSGPIDSDGEPVGETPYQVVVAMTALEETGLW